MTTQPESQRTTKQNKAIHKLFQLWADALNDAGKGMLVVLKDEVEIPWNWKSVEQYLWTPLRKEKVETQATFEALQEVLAVHIEVDTLPSLSDIMGVNLKKGLRIYFQIVADALNASGADMRVVLKPETEVWWDKDTVKEFLWRRVQKLQLGKSSTTQLTTKEIDEVYDTVNRHLGKHIDTVMFPSIEELIIQQSYENR